MKAKWLCLILCLALIFTGCSAAPEETFSSETVPESSETAAPDTVPTEPREPEGPVKTEQALKEISMLGSVPDDDYRIWYEVFVYAYCDSDGDGIGDLPGLISKLDEIQAMGFTGLWLMPHSPQHHLSQIQCFRLL